MEVNWDWVRPELLAVQRKRCSRGRRVGVFNLPVRAEFAWRSFNAGHLHSPANADPDASAQQDRQQVGKQQQGKDVRQADDTGSAQAQGAALAVAHRSRVTKLPILGRLLVWPAAPVPDPVCRNLLFLVENEGHCLVGGTVWALGAAAASSGRGIGVPLCLEEQLLQDVDVAREGRGGTLGR